MASMYQPMGPTLRGFTPPFTPSGKSSWFQIDDYEHGYPGVEGVHNGIYIDFEVDPDQIAKILPAPLKLTEKSSIASIFINQTTLMPARVSDVSDMEPDGVVFKEALITVPCEFNGQELAFHYVQFTDSDICMYISIIAGLTTKLADIKLFTPEPAAHPNWAMDKPGSLLKASVSRDGSRLITATLEIGERLTDEQAKGVFSDMKGIVSMRYFPDMANWTENKPLVHTLDVREQHEVVQELPYGGKATLEFGSTPTDEYDFFQPKRIVGGYYITRLAHFNRGLVKIYDYLEEEGKN